MYRGKFDRDKEWPFERLTHRKGFSDMKRRKRNTDLFGRWVLSLMERSAPRKRDPSKETFDTTGVRINPIHNEYLRQHIGAWDWLNYSPVDDESVGVDEVVVTHWFVDKER